jgi:hypothetical protein
MHEAIATQETESVRGNIETLSPILNAERE